MIKFTKPHKNQTKAPTAPFQQSTEFNSLVERKNDTLQMALNLCSAGYWVFNAQRDVIQIESQYLNSILTPHELEQIKTDGIWPFISQEDISKSENLWTDLVRDEVPQNGIMRFTTQTYGTRWFKFNISLRNVETHNEYEVLCLFMDITKTVQEENELREAKNIVEKDLNIRTDFLARLSHEIRTPMNAVIGIADAIVQHNSAAELNPKLELIQTSANKILKILDETLSHAMLDSNVFSLNPKPASPTNVVQSACQLWQAKTQLSGVQLRCQIKGTVPEQIIFDEFRYEQCINNLLSNAVKFTKNGFIDVVLTVMEKPNGSSVLVLAVRDTGIGMTHEQQNHIFDAYSQADQSISQKFGGTGLGMNITKQIIERMNGTITVKSQIGKGSVFAISIPIKIPQAVNSTQDPSEELFSLILDSAAPKEIEYSDLNILVVDDNATNHLVLNSLLDSVVSNIFRANNGQEAIQVLNSTDIDIVLMDIHMPVMDGIEATIAIRATEKPWKDVLIVALTADPQYQQKKLCINIGMDDALAKPVKLNDLRGAIDNVLKIREQRSLNKQSLAQTA